MANEITLGGSLSVVKGNLTYSRSISGKKITMTGTNATMQSQAIGTSAENLTIGADVGTLGMSWFRNLDATNYVEVGRDVSGTFYPLFMFKAGEGYPVRLVPGVTYQARANTASCDLEFAVFED